MNTLISILLFIAALTIVWWPSKLDAGARFAIRLWGTLGAVIFVSLALLLSSWWLALLAIFVACLLTSLSTLF